MSTDVPTARPTRTDATQQQEAWARDGFFIVRGMIDPDVAAALIPAAVDAARTTPAQPEAPLVHVPEGNVRSGAVEPEESIAKIFRLHRQEPFRSITRTPEILDTVATILGDDVDLFLSQFIFKWPEAYGQPWHQDSFYFPFEPDRQVGVWVAANEATLRNGCLWVLPGSHAEPVHTHVLDDRPNATQAYVKIVDHDMSAKVAVEMDPGDVLFFDSHLMHCSTDNLADVLRAAYVIHYAAAGTNVLNDLSDTVNDWVPVRRAGIDV